ncbi:MAG: hypothetical protein MJZ20_11945 [Bacteroidaceae bacterium]|nr:hypothetical protein [Bacteroidaceae bacterium]
MPINYSLSYRKVKVADLDDEGNKQYDENGELIRKTILKAYGKAQSIGTMTSEDFCRQIAAKGSYSRADITSILVVLKDALELWIRNGFRVDVGDMGKFYPSLSSKGVEDAKEFKPTAHIKKAYCNWARPSLMSKMRDVTFELVNTHLAQSSTNLASKEAQTDFTLKQSVSAQEAEAWLEKIRALYNVIVSVRTGDDDMGSVEGGGEDLKYGTKVFITATPNEGYLFEGWNDGDLRPIRPVVVERTASYTAGFANTSGLNISEVSNNGEPFVKGDDVDQINISGELLESKPISLFKIGKDNKIGEQIAGTCVIADDETSATFTPTNSFELSGMKGLAFKMDNKIHKTIWL